MQRAVGIHGVDAEFVAYAGRDADITVVGSKHHLTLIVEHEKSESSATLKGIEGVRLQVGVMRRLACSRQVIGELSQAAALAYDIRAAAFLPCCGKETVGEHIVHSVFDEQYLAVFLRVFGYLLKGAVDVGFAYRHGVSSVVLDVEVVERLKESPRREEVGEVFLCHLAHLAYELERAVVGVFPHREGVVAQRLEQLRVERCVLLGKVIVEEELVVHAQLAVDAPYEVGSVHGIVVHRHCEGRAAGGCDAAVVAYVVREEVVRHLGASLQVDGTLVVVSALVCRAPLIVVGVVDIE